MFDDTATILDILKTVSIFAETPDHVLAEIVPLLTEVNLKEGEILFEQGSPGNSMYIIVEGLVRVHRGNKTINNLGERDVIGEMAALSTEPRPDSVTTVQNTRLLCLTQETLYTLMENRPEIVQGVIDVLITHLRNRGEDLYRLRNRLEQVIQPLDMALSTEQNVSRLLERIMYEAQEICNADAGTLYLREGDTLKFAIMNTKSLGIALGGTTGQPISYPPLLLYNENGEPNHHNIATYVALNNQSLNIANVDYVESFDFSGVKTFDKEHNYRTVSCLNFPLRNHEQQVIGVLQLFNAQDPTTGQVIPFDPSQQFLVEALASQAAVALNIQMMLKKQETFVKVDRDLQIGHQIQVDFLPSPEQLPQRDGWEIATFFAPAREVAGDFFDAFPLAGNKIALVIADVVDKGVGAAIFMALSRSLIRAFAQQPGRPTKLLDRLVDTNTAPIRSTERRRQLPHAGVSSALSAVELTNNYIAKNHGEMCMFATLFFGVLDPDTGIMYYINGGHDAPIFLSADGKVKARLNPTGPAVGMMPDMEFGIEQITFDPGDLLLTFSDGVPDARNPQGERFTPERLVALLEKSQPVSSTTELLAHIETTLRTHISTADQFDDITMLTVQRKMG